MKSKGQTDRGDGELSDALIPTKVKGQITPGGQMPSITLKGVSIKGTSKVGYEEAVTAAQSRRPERAQPGQGPPRLSGSGADYFDDLKEVTEIPRSRMPRIGHAEDSN